MNLGVIAPGPGDGTSFYRAVGPLSYVSREHGVRLITAERWDWTNLLQCDAFFLQRPFDNEHGMLAKWCRGLQIPLWVDYDDLYSAFPDWTPVQQDKYGNPEALGVMQYCLQEASAVTVSTPALGMELQRLAPGIEPIVVPNALNTYLWSLADRPRERRITWRGSGGHIGDLDPHVKTIGEFAADFSDWEFHWLGRPHYRCAGIGTVHPYRDLFSYMETFQELAPAVHIVPLADCVFNRCKSNIAWLEASAAGACVVAPDLPEWRRPGVVRYREGAGRDGNNGSDGGPCFLSFREALWWAVTIGEKRRLELVGDSRKYILENLRLSNVNRKRWDVLEGLVEHRLRPPAGIADSQAPIADRRGGRECAAV